MTQIRRIVALTGALGALVFPSGVHAQTACPTTQVACSDTSALPNPVYMAGSSAFEPILRQLAIQINAVYGVSIIYSPISSCNGISSIYPDPSFGFGADPQPLTATPNYYVPSKTDPTVAESCQCLLPAKTYASIGVSDVAFDSCQIGGRPASVGEWLGPVQAMLIVVPKSNLTFTAISAEQAAVIWGCGQLGGFGRFIDENAIQQRSSTSGTQIMVARNIGSSDGSGGYRRVSETAFKGKTNPSSSALFTSLIAVPDPQTAIGFLANDFYATHRAQLNSIAFRGLGQTKAYNADSTSTADDLLNVREGRYMIQGPVHLFAKLSNVTDGGTPAPSAAIARVLGWLTGSDPIRPTDPSSYVSTIATNGAVPQCAMKVKLDKDGGYFSPYTPPVPCNCAFARAKSLPVASGACKPCGSDPTLCPAGTTCNFGYCE